MKSELFLMRTVKSRALLRLNETFYFLLCRVIASFKSSSTTCQARSCMIINTLRKYCFFFATIFNDIQNFWITVKVIKFNVKRNYPYHFIFAAITCKKTKKKKSDLCICFECNLKHLKRFEFFQILQIPYTYRIRLLCGPFTPIR